MSTPPLPPFLLLARLLVLLETITQERLKNSCHQSAVRALERAGEGEAEAEAYARMALSHSPALFFG